MCGAIRWRSHRRAEASARGGPQVSSRVVTSRASVCRSPPPPAADGRFAGRAAHCPPAAVGERRFAVRSDGNLRAPSRGSGLHKCPWRSAEQRTHAPRPWPPAAVGECLFAARSGGNPQAAVRNTRFFGQNSSTAGRPSSQAAMLITSRFQFWNPLFSTGSPLSGR